jgi:hypothetical protein
VGNNASSNNSPRPDCWRSVGEMCGMKREMSSAPWMRMFVEGSSRRVRRGGVN